MELSKGSLTTYVIMLLISAGLLAFAQQWYPDEEYTVWVGDEGVRRRQSAIKLDVEWLTDTLSIVSGVDTTALHWSDTLTVNGNGLATQFDIAGMGDITAVTAGTGLSGGGTSGAVTVSADSNSWIATDYWAKSKAIHFTILSPQDILGDSCIVWSAVMDEFQIYSIRAFATTDDYDFHLSMTAPNGTYEYKISDFTVSLNGTNIYYSDWTAPTDNSTAKKDYPIWFVPGADSTGWVKVEFYGRYN